MRPFALWFIPERSISTYFSDLIADLAARFGGPVFDPHMTGFSGRFEKDATLIQAVHGVMAGIDPFSVSAKEIGYSEDYFRTLFLELEESEIVSGIRKTFSASISANLSKTRPLHLSLLYRELDTDTKQTLARNAVNPYTLIRFDRVWLVRPGDLDLGWFNMENLNIIDEMGL